MVASLTGSLVPTILEGGRGLAITNLWQPTLIVDDYCLLIDKGLVGCLPRNMTPKGDWYVNWSWGINLQDITRIGQRRCIGTVRSVASGVYFYLLRAGDDSHLRRLVILK